MFLWGQPPRQSVVPKGPTIARCESPGMAIIETSRASQFPTRFFDSTQPFRGKG